MIGFTPLARMVGDLKQDGYAFHTGMGSAAGVADHLQEVQQGEELSTYQRGDPVGPNSVFLNARGLQTLWQTEHQPSSLAPGDVETRSRLETLDAAGVKLRPYDFDAYSVRPDLALAVLRSDRPITIDVGPGVSAPLKASEHPQLSFPPEEAFDRPEGAAPHALLQDMAKYGFTFQGEAFGPNIPLDQAEHRLNTGQSILFEHPKENSYLEHGKNVRLLGGADIIGDTAKFNILDVVKCLPSYLSKLDVAQQYVVGPARS